MNKKSLPKPSERELEILRILWDRGPSKVRDVHELLSGKTERGYTTTLKIMQIMAEKGLVKRDESEIAHVYKAGMSEKAAHRQIVANLLDGAFGGSPQKLVLSVLSAKQTTPEEIAEIRRLLDEMKEKKG